MADDIKAFNDFYHRVFLQEHRDPRNVALHMIGTMLSGAFVIGVMALGYPWLALLYPVAHAAPGLLGHRLFERNQAVGDLRVTRKDFSPLWFIAGNHRMTWEVLRRGLYWRTPL